MWALFRAAQFGQTGQQEKLGLPILHGIKRFPKKKKTKKRNKGCEERCPCKHDKTLVTKSHTGHTLRVQSASRTEQHAANSAERGRVTHVPRYSFMISSHHFMLH